MGFREIPQEPLLQAPLGRGAVTVLGAQGLRLSGLGSFHHEIEHFAMAIAGQVGPDVNAADAYQFMRILDALYDSAKSGEKVILS